MPRKRKRPGVIHGHANRHQRKGAKCRRVKSELTGAMIPATIKGLPCAGRPKHYDHGPGGWAKKRRELGRKLRETLRATGLGHLVDPAAD